MGRVVGMMHKHDYPAPDFYEITIGTVWQCSCSRIFALRGNRNDWSWDAYRGFYNAPTGYVYGGSE